MRASLDHSVFDTTEYNHSTIASSIPNMDDSRRKIFSIFSLMHSKVVPNLNDILGVLLAMGDSRSIL